MSVKMLEAMMKMLEVKMSWEVTWLLMPQSHEVIPKKERQLPRGSAFGLAAKVAGLEMVEVVAKTEIIIATKTKSFLRIVFIVNP